MDHDELYRELTILLEVTKTHTRELDDHESRIRNVEILVYKTVGVLGAISIIFTALWEMFKLIVK